MQYKWIFRFFLWMVPLCTLSLGGCGKKTLGGEGALCMYASDCRPELRCVQGKCSKHGVGEGGTCTLPGDCEENLICKDTKCVFDRSTPCKDNSSCGGNLKCIGGYCLRQVGEGKPCLTTEGCLPAWVCSSKGTCLKQGEPGTGGANEKCSDDEGCQRGLLCHPREGKCVPKGAEGLSCESGDECNKGLVCAHKGRCRPKGEPGTVAQGESCQKSEDCQRGLACNALGKCVTGGSAQEGADCKGNEDCAAGLRCAAQKGEATGKCAKPGAPGTAYVGEECKKAEDCALGLLCGPLGKCMILRGYKGTTCEDPSNIAGPFRAFFEIPRDSKRVKEFYRLPFPNDIRRNANGYIDLTGHPNPGPLLGEDLVGKYIKAIEAELKGFGPNQTVYFRFSQSIDFNTLKLSGDRPAMRYINLENGQRQGLSVSYHNGRGKYICHYYITARHYGRTPLKHNQTYAVIVTRVIKSASGDSIQRDGDFELMLKESPPSDPQLARAHARYKKLRDYLKENDKKGVYPGSDDVVAAAVFTTQDPDQHFAKFREEVHKHRQPVFKEITLCDGKTQSPCDDGKGVSSRACGEVNSTYYEIHARVSLPIFQTGKPPYVEKGGDIEYESDGTPRLVRREEVCLALTIPKGVAPQEGWPVVLYAHGTAGNFRSHIADKTAERLSKITVEGGKRLGFATLGIDQVVHGMRRNKDETHPNFLFFNFSNPQASLNNTIQGAVDHFTLVRLVRESSIPTDKSPTGKEITFDKERIAFLGHSQGGFVGPLFLAYEPQVKAAVLSGAGGNLTLSLLNKTKPVDIAAGIRALIGEPSVDKTHPLLNLIQLYFERADAVNYGHLLTLQPPAGGTPKHLFQSYGLDDSFTAPETMNALAYTLGVQEVKPNLKPIKGISEKAISPPVRGNKEVEKKKYTAVLVQYKPADYDGHFVIFRHSDAIRHLTRFLGTFVTDAEGIPTLVK